MESVRATSDALDPGDHSDRGWSFSPRPVIGNHDGDAACDDLFNLTLGCHPPHTFLFLPSPSLRHDQGQVVIASLGRYDCGELSRRRTSSSIEPKVCSWRWIVMLRAVRSRLDV